MAKVLIDTGPIVALLNEREADHQAVKNAFATLRPPLFTCWPVITEAAYLLRNYPRRINALLSACEGHPLEICTIEVAEIELVKAILSKYEDQRFDLADACMMHLAERMPDCQIFTLDLRDFTQYRTTKGVPLSLLEFK